MTSRREEREELLAFALGYPDAHLDHPWGEDVVKVRGKVFVFFGIASPDLFVGVKLPISGTMASAQPFAEAMGYNLGRAGWISARFGPDDDPPLDVLRDWIDESYRSVAPKRLSASAPRPS